MIEVPPVHLVHDINDSIEVWKTFQDSLNTVNVDQPDVSGATVLERYFKISSFKEAYTGVRLVSFREIEGYGKYLYPNKLVKKAYISLQPIALGNNYDEIEFVAGFRKALDNSLS